MHHQDNWLDWAFKLVLMFVTICVIVILRALWFGFWGLVERLPWGKRN